MSPTLLTAYVLVWPIIATGVFLVLSVGLIKDIRKAKKEGDSLV